MAEAKKVAKGVGTGLAAIVIAITAGAKSCSKNARRVGYEAKKWISAPGQAPMVYHAVHRNIKWKKILPDDEKKKQEKRLNEQQIKPLPNIFGNKNEDERKAMEEFRKSFE